jgi:hypothetical protein
VTAIFASLLTEKEAGLRVSWPRSLASFKQQVMVDVGASSDVNRPIVVETPTILFHVLNCFTNILVAVNIHAFPFLQPNLTP